MACQDLHVYVQHYCKRRCATILQQETGNGKGKEERQRERGGGGGGGGGRGREWGRWQGFVLINLDPTAALTRFTEHKCLALQALMFATAVVGSVRLLHCILSLICHCTPHTKLRWLTDCGGRQQAG